MPAMTRTATVLGASGFAGGELLGLLAGHPELALAAASGEARAGERIDRVHPQLRGAVEATLVTTEEAAGVAADVCFSCLPAGVLAKHLEDVAAPVVVDLADDHRSSQDWVYGLTEFARPELAGATRVANPGCYPTAALLCLVPFVRAKAVSGPIVIDAVSGLSGAGRKLEDRLLLATAAGNVGAYGDVRHRHVPEIESGLDRLGGAALGVSFTPHLAPIPRGLLVTARAVLTETLDDHAALKILRDAYEEEAFVEVLTDWPQTKAVAGTNRAHVGARVDASASLLVASAAIDNLGKGAAGQALQNANVIFGLPETTGLTALGVWP